MSSDNRRPALDVVRFVGRRLGSGPPAFIIPALLALLLSLPSLGLGYVLDDKIHQVILRSDLAFIEPVEPLWDLFAFMDGTEARNHKLMDRGVFPWWTDPHLRAQFLRPISALTHIFDHAIAPKNAVFAHAHSLVWLVACVLLAGSLYRRTLRATPAAGLAVLMFAVDDAHGIPAAWLANRNALIALAFGLAAILCHHEAYGRRRWGVAALGPVMLLVSLLAAEAGIATVAYLIAFALFCPRPWWQLSSAGRLRRLATLVPYMAVVVGWKVAHSAGNYGAANSGLYVDPLGEPWSFVQAVIIRVPILLTAQWTPVPADLAMVAGAGVRALWAASGALLVIVLSGWVWRCSERRWVVAMWLTGSILAALPVAAAFPSNRLLMFVGLGVFGALGAVMDSWLYPHSSSPRFQRAGRLLMVALAFSHLVLAPIALLAAAPSVNLLGESLPGRCANAVESDAPLNGVTLVFVNAHALCAAYVGPSRALSGATMPARVRVLASIFSDMEIERVDARSLRVHVPAGYHRHPMDRLMRRDDRPLPVGSNVALTGFTAVVEGHSVQGRVDQVRFTFDEPLESPRLRFFELTAEGTRPFVMPTVGTSVRVFAQLPLI